MNSIKKVNIDTNGKINSGLTPGVLWTPLNTIVDKGISRSVVSNISARSESFKCAKMRHLSESAA